MLLCETTLGKMSFEDFQVLYVTERGFHDTVEEWLTKNPPMGGSQKRGVAWPNMPIPWAYINRLGIPGLSEVEVLA